MLRRLPKKGKCIFIVLLILLVFLLFVVVFAGPFASYLSSLNALAQVVYTSMF